MCGINGIQYNKQINDIEKRITIMNNALAHRGPDNSSYRILSNRIVLGHRRLSIIDTNARSNQPMSSNSGRWTIVFNGEIYNFEELKSGLKYSFKTTSDTEVILAYIERYGYEKFLKDSNGMFAIALYDSCTDNLVLARDRFGIKPLFYCFNDDNLIFSSEIKGILKSGLVQATFNEQAIDEYLGYRYVREPHTFFKNIYQLESGTYMVIDNHLNHKSIKYWDLPKKFNMDEDYNESLLSQQLEKKILNAIKMRMISDVPLGTYLSGGVDSSLISAITSIYSDHRVNTYTIGFPELNEFRYARMVAEKYNTIHHEINMSTSEYFELMNEVISYKDAPLGVPNEIPLSKMSKVLKEEITVVLSGEGADELMGGYGRIFRSPFDYKNHLREKSSFYDYFIGLYEYVPRSIRDKYLNSEKNLRNEFDIRIMHEFDQLNNEENVFRFFHRYHIKGLLNRVDTTTMLASVEARVPFLDHELVEFTYNEVPYDLKLRWNSFGLMEQSRKSYARIYSEQNDTPKYLLRNLSYNYLPNEIIERKKIGFPVPLDAWISELEEKAYTILKDAYWLKTEAISELIADSKSNQRSGQIIWMFINIELFRNKYFNYNWQY